MNTRNHLAPLAPALAARAAVMVGAALAFAAVALGAALALAAPAPPAGGAAAAPGSATRLKLTRASFVIGHRVFTDFRDVVSAKPHESFRVGDTDYTAKVVEFQPDFTMDLKTRKVTSRTQEPKNPAVRVIVWKHGTPDDTSWAFLNMPPHYGRKSMLAFRLTRLEFENHAPIDAPKDTSAVVRGGAAK